MVLQSHDVSDLCIGKPPVRWLPPSSTVADAIAEIEAGGGRGPDAAVAVWDGTKGEVDGRVCMADVHLFLCGGDGEAASLASPAAALQATLSDLLAAGAPPVRRIEPHARSRPRHVVVEAVDAFLDGAHCLVVPIRERWRRAAAAAGEMCMCWLTVEDVVRFFVGSIGLFAPTASLSVSQLGIVRPATLAVAAGNRALSAVPLLRAALATHSSVAVITGAGIAPRLAGEVSPSTLCSCDVSVAAAIAALSAGDLTAFLHRSDLRCRRNLPGIVDLLYAGDPSSWPPSPSTSSSSSSSSLSSFSSSSDDEAEDGYKHYAPAPCARRRGSNGQTIACHPGSSLVAVMAQAVAHRVTQVWVVDADDGELVGVVRFLDVLWVLREHLNQPPPDLPIEFLVNYSQY
uniref:CBS domain-containing protein n=1 Tax=Oryza glumipatula TaxID=40148 RepID=A0A0D9ZSI4_9ORYZ